MPLSNDPAAVVQRQLDAFNARDLDVLLATYAEDAEMFEHPSKLLASGAAAFRERYTARFQESNLYATLLSRTVMGHIVVDHEEVSRTTSRRSQRLLAIAVPLSRSMSRIRRGLAFFVRHL
jgi:hypothetical protein